MRKRIIRTIDTCGQTAEQAPSPSERSAIALMLVPASSRSQAAVELEELHLRRPEA